MTNPNKYSLINPNKSPFFYGYIILFVGTLGVFASMPGQTVGVSVFTDPVKDALGLSRNQFSNAYMIGTICSSLLISRAGRWFDTYGARLVAFFAAVGLGLALLLSSLSAKISTAIMEATAINTWVIPFCIITILFFMLRFCGQGVLTMASRNVIMIWFDNNRGKVNSLTAIVTSLAFSSSPLWVNQLIDNFGWEGAWQMLGIGLLVFSIIILQCYRNSPEQHGLLPDGTATQENEVEQKKVAKRKQYTLKEAKTTRAFWMYGLMLAFNSFFSTGLTFHIVSIFGTQGYEKAEAIAIFLPVSIVAISISALFNWLSDYLQLKWYLFSMITAGFLASFGLLMLGTNVGVVCLIIGLGVMSGFFSVLNAIVWPRFYGRQHLGAITGKIMSILVLASAFAPTVFSLCFSTLNSYTFLGYLGLLFLAFVFVASFKANTPQVRAD